MSRVRRLAVVVLGGLGVLATAAPVHAQFIGGFVGPGLRPVRPVPGVRPVGLNPLAFNYAWQTTYSIPSPLGGPTLSYSTAYYGPAGLALQMRGLQSYSRGSSYPRASSYSSGYMTGGVRTTNLQANQDFARAQRAATSALTAAPRTTITELGAYERFTPAAPAGLKPAQLDADALGKALAATDERDVASGVALNHVLTAAVAAEAKGPKVDSAYLAPNLLAEVRFSGSPAADALNRLRQAGKLDLPAAFDAAPLADLRPVLDREFAAAAAPVLAGRPADPAKVAKLDETLKKARDVLSPMIKDMEFAEAAAARRFINQMDATVKVLKGNGAAGLFDPKWSAEGTNVADLTRHMTRNKLQFGPADKGNEEAYLALQRGLVAYLFALKDGQKPAPK